MMEDKVQQCFNANRRRVLTAVAAGLAGAALPGGAWAQAPGSKGPLRIVYPFAPGGEWDTLIRAVGARMGQQLQMPAIVENKPGGSGRIGTNYLLKLDPPGYNLIFAPIAQLVFVPIVQPHSDYDVQRDLVPVAQVATFDSCCAVSTSLGINNLADFIAWVRKNPSKANCGLSGMGGLHHFIAIALQKTANIDFQFVYYKGGGQLRTDLLAGHVPFSFGTAPEMVPLHRSGKVKIIATSGTSRVGMLPDVPTYKEQGVDLVAQGWYSLFASAKTPPAVLKSLEDSSVSAIKDAPIQKLIVDIGSVPSGLGSAATRNLIRSDIERWGPIIKSSGFKLER
jgi:tripartite-type tricarboxylate transporter receptor subunit TctC